MSDSEMFTKTSGRRLAPGRTRRKGPRFGPATLLLPLALAACAPILRSAEHQGAQEANAAATLLGPFDGQVIDANTNEPLSDALVIGIWSVDGGQGFVTPRGSQQLRTTTDAAGRYRIPEAPHALHGQDSRLVSFHLIVYKRGYRSYRSDRHFDGQPRRDFTQRHNDVKLEKWRSGDSHAAHLVHLAATRDLAQSARWERDQANLDLYRALGGERAASERLRTVAKPPEGGREAIAEAAQLLDASSLIAVDELSARTGIYQDFQLGDLQDLPRSSTYHGVHFRAVDAEATSDFAYRVWQKPAEGLDALAKTFASNLPGVEESDEVTARTWLFENADLRAVAFIDETAESGVLLTCGVDLCIDLETTIILAKLLHGRLDQVELVDDLSTQDPATPAANENADATQSEP